MKIRVLFQALKFACLPTLSILLLLFFGFFSISKTIAFISSDNGWAIFIRVVLVIAEIALVYVMYEHYNEEDTKKQIFENKDLPLKKGREVIYHREVYQLFNSPNSNNKHIIYPTENDNLILVEREPKK